MAMQFVIGRLVVQPKAMYSTTGRLPREDSFRKAAPLYDLRGR
jgi:hypothetical protein